jgi:hypothetical protein
MIDEETLTILEVADKLRPITNGYRMVDVLQALAQIAGEKAGEAAKDGCPGFEEAWDNASARLLHLGDTGVLFRPLKPGHVA